MAFVFQNPGQGLLPCIQPCPCLPGRGRVVFTLWGSGMAAPIFSRSILTLFTGEWGEQALSVLLETFCQAKRIKYLLSQIERAGGALIFDC